MSTPRQPNVGPCSVEGCNTPSRKRGWCASHYAQARRTGEDPKPFLWKWGQSEPRPKVKRTTKPDRGCAVEGCLGRHEARGYCLKHVTRLRRHGSVDIAQRTVREFQPTCSVCGSTEREIASRHLCSKRCERLFYAYDGAVPTTRTCAQCGTDVDLLDLTPRGNRRRVDGGLCDGCQKESWRTACLSVQQLAERDGTDCSICGEGVDMELRRADSLMCPSIDHVVPRSLGGSNAPDNLALAHLRCNIRKSNKVEVA